MKYVLTYLALLLITISFAQNDKALDEELTFTDNISIHIKIDSLENFESSFNSETVEALFEENKNVKEIEFKITCKNKDDQEVRSYGFKGNLKDKEYYINQIKNIKKQVIEYYTSKQ